MEEARGIYRGEVMAIIGALADIYHATPRILELLEDEGEDDETTPEMDA